MTRCSGCCLAVGIENRIWLLLKREVNVEESSKSMYRHAMLRVVEEISLAALIARIPFENIEMGIFRTLRCP